MQFSEQKVERERARIMRMGAANLMLVAAVVMAGLIAGTWLAFVKSSPEKTRTEPRSPNATLAEPRSPEKTRAEPRSPEKTRAEPRSPEKTRTEPRSPTATRAEPRSPEKTRTEPRSPTATRTEPRSPGNVVGQSNPKKFPVTIGKPSGPPRVLTGINDIHGQPVTVACSTCHATRAPNFENKSVADLNEFHGSLAFTHGTVSCLSCHNSTDYDALKLADGTRIEFVDVMTLCAQCHGPQMRDYQHGAHGGFNGYWDLTRGPQEKNNCVDCHNPHAPQFPKMQPTFKPRDRFLEKADLGDGH